MIGVNEGNAPTVLLLRRLGILDLSLITVGSVIGSGIFRSPSVVAARAHAPVLIIGAWLFGGVIALFGVWIFAELAARRPSEGGYYAYLRDAFHPVVAFVFGWLFIFVSSTGGVAASGIIFANYFEPLTGLAVAPWILASVAISFFTVVNFFGVRQGGTVQNVLVASKLSGLAMLIGVGAFARPGAATVPSFVQSASNSHALAAFGIALIPVFFAYNGYISPTFVIGETKNPQRTVPLGLVIGIAVVIVTYLAVNLVCLNVLGAGALGITKTPASDVMGVAFGAAGARVIAIVVTLSTLGFISTNMLVNPRVVHRMAVDGRFFKEFARLHPKSRAPIFAIALQGSIAIVIAASGTFESIINYIVSFDSLLFALAAVALVVFRRRDAGSRAHPRPFFTTPGHPYTTLVFFVVVSGVFIGTFVTYPSNTAVGIVLVATGAVAYYLWQRQSGTLR